ncbi:hypothetical protein A4A49_59945, partial [Nicotiana attenuata]
ELKEKVTALEALVGTVDGDHFLTIVTRLAYLEAEMNRLSQECTDLKAENVLLRCAVGIDEAQRGANHTKVKIPESKEFNGARTAKKLENFLWDMEQYFQAAHEKQCAGPSTNKGQNSKFDGCFICKGPHMVRDCPKLVRLSTLFAKEKSEDEPNEEEKEQQAAYLGPIVVLKNAKTALSRTTNSSDGDGLLAP